MGPIRTPVLDSLGAVMMFALIGLCCAIAAVAWGVFWLVSHLAWVA